MIFTIRNGKHLFTVCGLSKAFDSFSKGLEWAFVTKQAMKVAMEMESA